MNVSRSAKKFQLDLEHMYVKLAYNFIYIKLECRQHVKSPSDTIIIFPYMARARKFASNNSKGMGEGLKIKVWSLLMEKWRLCFMGDGSRKHSIVLWGVSQNRSCFKAGGS